MKNLSFEFVVEEFELLMPYLTKKMPAKSRSAIKSLLVNKQILVNKKPITQFNHTLNPKDLVQVLKTIPREPIILPKIEIVFEDDSLIVIDKSAGLLSISNDNKLEQTAYSILYGYVKAHHLKNKIFILHRLDKDTSGLMVFAKSIEIQEFLQSNWNELVTQRKYTALVEGVVEKQEGTITSWLKENSALVMYSSPRDNGGQKAITHYKVLKKTNDYTLLDVLLETGRKNQIRVHMQDLGYSVVGDKKYGATSNPIGRLGLHASMLAFIHPITNEEIVFETKIPSRFLSVF